MQAELVHKSSAAHNDASTALPTTHAAVLQGAAAHHDAHKTALVLQNVVGACNQHQAELAAALLTKEQLEKQVELLSVIACPSCVFLSLVRAAFLDSTPVRIQFTAIESSGANCVQVQMREASPAACGTLVCRWSGKRLICKKR